MVYENGDQNDSHSLIRPFFLAVGAYEAQKKPPSMFLGGPRGPLQRGWLVKSPVTILFFRRNRFAPCALALRIARCGIWVTLHQLPYRHESKLVTPKMDGWYTKNDQNLSTCVFLLRPNFDPYLLWRLNPFFVAESSFSPNHPQFLVGLMPLRLHFLVYSIAFGGAAKFWAILPKIVTCFFPGVFAWFSRVSILIHVAVRLDGVRCKWRQGLTNLLEPLQQKS